MTRINMTYDEAIQSSMTKLWSGVFIGVLVVLGSFITMMLMNHDSNVPVFGTLLGLLIIIWHFATSPSYNRLDNIYNPDPNLVGEKLYKNQQLAYATIYNNYTSSYHDLAPILKPLSHFHEPHGKLRNFPTLDHPDFHKLLTAKRNGYILDMAFIDDVYVGPVDYTPWLNR
jgi:hypothetical protein